MIEHYEAGGEMVELRVGDWATLGADATALRMAVFVQEQGIDPAIELDAHDPTAVHAVAYNRLAQPVATGRLLYEAPGDARIGRMAVDRVVRGQRWGRAGARCSGAGRTGARRRPGDAARAVQRRRLYRRAGFVPVGAVFEERASPTSPCGARLLSYFIDSCLRLSGKRQSLLA